MNAILKESLKIIAMASTAGKTTLIHHINSPSNNYVTNTYQNEYHPSYSLKRLEIRLRI